MTGNPRQPHFPMIKIEIPTLVQTVRRKLSEVGVSVKDVRLNGGAASYVLGNDSEPTYSDFDLIFGVNLDDDDGSEKG